MAEGTSQSRLMTIQSRVQPPILFLLIAAVLFHGDGVFHKGRLYRLRVLGQWFDGIRFYAAASNPRRSRRTWAGLR